MNMQSHINRVRIFIDRHYNPDASYDKESDKDTSKDISIFITSVQEEKFLREGGELEVSIYLHYERGCFDLEEFEKEVLRTLRKKLKQAKLSYRLVEQQLFIPYQYTKKIYVYEKEPIDTQAESNQRFYSKIINDYTNFVTAANNGHIVNIPCEEKQEEKS